MSLGAFVENDDVSCYVTHFTCQVVLLQAHTQCNAMTFLLYTLNAAQIAATKCIHIYN